MICSNPNCQKKLSGCQKIYCSSSCAAVVNNKKRLKKRCKICDKLMPKAAQHCCSRSCYVLFNRRRLNERVKKGSAIGSRTIRACLNEIKNACWECDTSVWNGKPLSLQVDHVDGNAENNTFNNLRLLCPNCHSQTSTFGSKNRGNGRKSRRLARRAHKAKHGFCV